ncbi:MAG TPA: hypothetical protein VIL72_05055 [Beijerinckiaceae bacterium]
MSNRKAFTPTELASMKLVFSRLCEERGIEDGADKADLARLLLERAEPDCTPEELMHFARMRLRGQGGAGAQASGPSTRPSRRSR